MIEFVDGAPDDLSLVDDPYGTLPWSGPETAGVGHALTTMVEPHRDRLREYNRWYEDNHYFDGAMALPWMFSGRHRRTGNVSLARDHVVTSFQSVGRRAGQDHAGSVYRDADVPDVRWSLVDPPAGLVLQVVDADVPEDRDALERWLLTEHLARRLGPGSPATCALVFRTNPPDPGHSEAVYRSQLAVTNGGRRLTVLWMLDRDPREIWAEHFVDEVERVLASGLGRTALVAPFLPCRMGTNAYEDALFD